MVILQFNKLIRNKWVWGVFAILVSLAFCFDDLLISRDRGERQEGAAGKLGDEVVSAKDFSKIADDVRGFGRQRDWKRNQGDINREAWETYAALEVAKKNGIEATAAEVREMIANDRSFQDNGNFNFNIYRMVLAQNGLDELRYEEFLKRRATIGRIGSMVLGSATWGSPMEVDQALADMTDTFTVKVAKFTHDPKDAAAVKVDDVALKKWYDENTNSIALPERIKIRYVKYDATNKDLLAKMTVTEDEMRDRYDVTVDKYTSTDTNGVEKVKKFEEVKSGIEKELRQIAAVQFFETNLLARAYSVKSAKKRASRLDEIAKEDKAKVETSDWFSTEGDYKEGFMRRATSILPGAEGFLEAVAELDSSSEDLRYGVVASERAVWLIEKFEVSPKHMPSFAEAKDKIHNQALRDAKAAAFKASVEAIAKDGAKKVLASKNVSTNIVFTVADMKQGEFENQMQVAHAAMTLKKGEVSEFTLLRPGQAILVVCEDRVAGDAAKAMVLRSQVTTDITMAQQRQLPGDWLKANLERIGFETKDISSVEKVSEEE